MQISIHRTIPFEKQMENLRNSGGPAACAAKKAEEIIDRMIIVGPAAPSAAGKLTKNGEMRIRYCKKYDLGSGYRLICIHRKFHVILLYLGTHDECSRWIEHNRGLHIAIQAESNKFTITPGTFTHDYESGIHRRSEDEYEEQLMKSIDERILRRVFSGITGVHFSS